MELEPEHYSDPAGWAIVLYGCVLSFISAFTPFFATGYQFQFELLLAGFTPYLIYGIAVPLLPGSLTTTVGIVLAAIHTGLVVAVRLFGAGEDLMYTLPGILAVLVIPLVVFALARTGFHKHGRRHLIRH